MHPDLPLTTTHEVRDRCLCLHSQRAARRLARKFDDLLKPHGVTNGQFSLLMSLNRPNPPRMTDLTELLGMDRTTLTAALKVVSRKGFVTTAPDEKDKRAKRLSLTDAGRAVLIGAMPLWCEAHAAIEAALKGITADQLRDGLNQLAAF